LCKSVLDTCNTVSSSSMFLSFPSQLLFMNCSCSQTSSVCAGNCPKPAGLPGGPHFREGLTKGLASPHACLRTPHSTWLLECSSCDSHASHGCPSVGTWIHEGGKMHPRNYARAHHILL
jgi:hypothetical protein